MAAAAVFLLGREETVLLQQDSFDVFFKRKLGSDLGHDLF
jgi:hypothetical protein